MTPEPLPHDSVPIGGIPAGYGRSCTNCSKAKCRCILMLEGSKCDRCHRLGKDCQQMVTSRKRIAKRTTTASRTAQLEEKLDDLVSILRATQQQPLPPPPPPLPNYQPIRKASPGHSPESPYPSCLSRLDSLADAATTSEPSKAPVFGLASRLPNLRDSDRLPEPTPIEADIYLSKFRHWLEFFPFMYLGPEVTSESLRRDCPFLWFCIMNITTMSLPQQTMMRNRVRQEVAQRVVVDHERSLDILLGLITLVTWSAQNASPGEKPFLTLYTQLASCIIYELGLTRFPNEEHYTMICYKPSGCRVSAPVKERTMEERRAVLAFWFVTSACSSFHGKLETLVWTPHMQESLDVLESKKEQPLDEVLVTLVKLQLIGEEARQLLARDMLNRDVMGDGCQSPTYIFKKSLLSQLQAIQGDLSPSLASKYIVQSHLVSTEAQIQAIGLFGQPRIPDAPRIDAMYASVVAARAWYDALFTVPLIEVPGMPLSVFVQLSQISALLYRLTVIDDPVWDKDIIRNTADPIVNLDRSIDLFQSVETVYPVRGDSDDLNNHIFAKCSKILRAMRTSWAPALHQHLGGIPTPDSQIISGGGEPGLMVDQPIMPHQGMSVDFNDFSWMTDIFTPWEF